MAHNMVHGPWYGPWLTLRFKTIPGPAQWTLWPTIRSMVSKFQKMSTNRKSFPF